MSTTILYYTSNKEYGGFEQRVRENILKQNPGHPIISVSQKPIDFGKNICVGDDIGVSGFNMFRQVLLGCKEADTDFILSAEADCLYPPTYFQWEPPRKDICYRNNNLYVMPDVRDYFFYKREGATHAQIIGREFYIERLEKLFEGAPMWSAEEKNFPKERHKMADVFHKEQIEYYATAAPVFQIKTHKGMRYYTNSERVPIKELPYWGEGRKLRPYYLHGKEVE